MEYALDLESVESEGGDDVDVAGWKVGRAAHLDAGVGDGDIIALNGARGEVTRGPSMSRVAGGEERTGDEERGDETFGV